MATERLNSKEPIKRVTHKNGNIAYRLIVDIGKDENGKRKQACHTFSTLKEARAKYAEIKTDVAKGKHVARTSITVNEYLTMWLEGQHDLKPTTRAGYEGALRAVVDAYGSLRLQDLTKQHLDRLVKERAENGNRRGKSKGGVSARTNALMLSVLGNALNTAVNEQLIHVNVARLVKSPKDRDKNELEAWTADQARAFLTLAAEDRYAAAWRLSLYGMRRGEVLGLTWANVDFENACVYVTETRVVVGSQVIKSTTKNDKPRRVPLGEEVIADLMAFKMLQDIEASEIGDTYNPLGLVVVNEIGTPLRPERYGDLFQKLIVDTELPRIRLHDLRHAAASLLVSSRIPLVTVAAMLGHDVNVLISTYAHAYNADVDDAAAVLSAIYRQPVG